MQNETEKTPEWYYFDGDNIDWCDKEFYSPEEAIDFAKRIGADICYIEPSKDELKTIWVRPKEQ